mgnify:FL=1
MNDLYVFLAIVGFATFLIGTGYFARDYVELRKKVKTLEEAKKPNAGLTFEQRQNLEQEHYLMFQAEEIVAEIVASQLENALKKLKNAREINGKIRRNKT